MGTKLLAWLWKFSDVILFLAAVVVLNITAYHAGWLWFGLTLALSLFLSGLACEFIAQQEGR